MDINHIDSTLFLSLAIIVYFVAKIILAIKQIRQHGQPQKMDLEKQPLEVVEGRKLKRKGLTSSRKSSPCEKKATLNLKPCPAP